RMTLHPAFLVSQAVDRLHTDLEEHIHRPSRLDEKHDRTGRKRCHHGLDEISPRERRIGDRRPIQVTAARTEIQKISEGSWRGLVADATAGRERALQFISADDLAHVHKDWDIGITYLDDVQENLLLQ